MTALRISLACIALTLISFVALPRCSQAATLADFVAAQKMLYGSSIKIRDTRTISIFQAVAGQTVGCYMLRRIKTNGQLGYRPEQFTVLDYTAQGDDEAHCLNHSIPP